ncbi:MAG: hypothetical protein LBM16_03000, partial [Clostridiales bacterium]|nr:hypothetical protein [Clostridiales bacterium]
MPDENNAQELLDNDSTAEQNKSSIAELLDMSTASIMELLYNNINALFGAGNQLFVMEFPTRSLSLKSYEYTINDCYSTLTKPYPVAENEFMLSEQMFDISPIVQGSNGEKLSTVYSTVLNNFVPKLETLDAFIKDQASLRKWLTEDVTDEVDGVEQTMSRMAMAKLLYGQYLDKRNEWYSEKEEKYDIYKSQDKLDEYTKWLSSEGLVHEEQLNNFYNDAIVRGHYHEVLTLLGFLNVSSPSEVLESTKQKMRSSLRRSMDGSSDVYPVQFMPADWFKSLKPNLQPKDLTVATDRLLVEYNNKRDRLRTLKRELAELSLNELSPAEKERIERELEQAESAVSQSEMNMVNQYGEGAVSVVKSVIKIYEQYANPATAAETAIAEARTAVDNNTATKDQTRLVSMIGDIAGNVVSGITNLYAAQQENIAKITHLSEARLAFASSKVRDMRAQRLRLEEQIESVQADIDYLAPLVTSTISASMQGEKPGEALLPAENESDGEDNFTEIIISKEKESQATSNQQTSSTQSSSWGVSVLIGSAGGSKSTSEGTNTNGESKLKNSMQIGLRVKKVSIERGGWFNP